MMPPDDYTPTPAECEAAWGPHAENAEDGGYWGDGALTEALADAGMWAAMAPDVRRRLMLLAVTCVCDPSIELEDCSRCHQIYEIRPVSHSRAPGLPPCPAVAAFGDGEFDVGYDGMWGAGEEQRDRDERTARLRHLVAEHGKRHR